MSSFLFNHAREGDRYCCPLNVFYINIHEQFIEHPKVDSKMQRQNYIFELQCCINQIMFLIKNVMEYCEKKNCKCYKYL